MLGIWTLAVNHEKACVGGGRKIEDAYDVNGRRETEDAR
jgi:hypothetical protein